MASIKGSESLDEWRRLFATAKNSSVFDILDQAITIAATDYSDELPRPTRPGFSTLFRVLPRVIRAPIKKFERLT